MKFEKNLKKKKIFVKSFNVYLLDKLRNYISNLYYFIVLYIINIYKKTPIGTIGLIRKLL